MNELFYNFSIIDILQSLVMLLSFSVLMYIFIHITFQSLLRSYFRFKESQLKDMMTKQEIETLVLEKIKEALETALVKE